MRVRILYLGLVRNKVGKKEEDYEIRDRSSLLDLLNSLSETYGKSLKGIFGVVEQSRLDPTLIVTVNGTLKDPLRGNDVTLSGGDTIAFMTLISGG